MQQDSRPESEDTGGSVPTNLTAVRILLDNQAAFKGFLRRHLPSDEVAEDLLQQGLLKAIRNPDQLADTENATAWFYRILRNTLTDFYRSRAADARRQEGFLNELVTSGADSHAATDAELKNEVCACLKRLLPVLKPEYADLLQKIDLDGEEPAMVAEKSGITYNNLMVRLHRARQALRKSLEHSCGACTKHGCLDCSCGHGQGHDQAHP